MRSFSLVTGNDRGSGPRRGRRGQPGGVPQDHEEDQPVLIALRRQHSAVFISLIA